MVAKQLTGQQAPDGSRYVALTDGAGNLSAAGGGGGTVDISDAGGVNIVAVKASSIPPVITDPALVVSVSPNSAGIVTLGQTTKSASLPVAIASDQFGQATKSASLPVVIASDQLGGTTPSNSLPVVQAGFTYAHISTAATTVVKSGAGVVHTITVNNLGTVASTTTVYDNTAGSGTVIAIINTLAGQTSYIYDVAFATGLTLVTTGTVAPDITVSYR